MSETRALTGNGLDRRIRQILGRLAGTSGGEALAALLALERLLPVSASLADVIFVGLHHMRQDLIDPSLVRELRALGTTIDELQRKDDMQASRIARLERALGNAVEAMEKASVAIDDELAGE